MSEEPQFEFHKMEPAAALSDAVGSLWFARGTVPYKQEHISPTGSCVAIFVFGDPIEQQPLAPGAVAVCSKFGLFVGPHDGPLINRPTGETHAVGIVMHPVGTERLFNIRPAAHRGRVDLLEHIWPEAEKIHAGLVGVGTGPEKLERLHGDLANLLGPERNGEAVCRRAIEILEATPKIPISELAKMVDISVSSLDRTFTRLVGLTPRSLSNLLKLRDLLSDLDVTATIDWAGLAAEYGWYDQSHFVKAFKRHTGHTPTEYVAAQRAHFDESTLKTAAGFVPQS